MRGPYSGQRFIRIAHTDLYGLFRDYSKMYHPGAKLLGLDPFSSHLEDVGVIWNHGRSARKNIRYRDYNGRMVTVKCSNCFDIIYSQVKAAWTSKYGDTLGEWPSESDKLE